MNKPSGKNQFLQETFVPVAMLVVAMFCAWNVFESSEYRPFLKVFIFAGACVAPIARQRWMIGLFFFLALFIWATGNSWFRSSHIQMFPKVAFAMGYAIAALRFTDMNFGFGTSDSSHESTAPIGSDAFVTWSSLRPFSSGWLPVVLAMIGAYLLLRLVPYDESIQERLQILPYGWRAIVLGWLLAVAWFVMTGLLQIVTLVQKKRDVAMIYSRSMFCKELGSELKGIEHRRSRLMARRPKKYDS